MAFFDACVVSQWKKKSENQLQVAWMAALRVPWTEAIQAEARSCGLDGRTEGAFVAPA